MQVAVDAGFGLRQVPAMGILDLKLFRRTPRPDQHLWHKCDPWWPFHRLIDGRSAEVYGQMWRRWNGTRWEYKQDEETEDEAQSRVW